MFAVWSAFIDLIANKKSWQEKSKYVLYISESGYFCSATFYLTTAQDCAGVVLKLSRQTWSLIQNLQICFCGPIPPLTSLLSFMPFLVPQVVIFADDKQLLKVSRVRQPL